ncbi:hypothetical protein N7523_000173 [Penicillium sp. IBT 18751x]|nr:hypothetical protein N7523_000173 [Penicillium sp. IBT 18751x]
MELLVTPAEVMDHSSFVNPANRRHFLNPNDHNFSGMNPGLYRASPINEPSSRKLAAALTMDDVLSN